MEGADAIKGQHGNIHGIDRIRGGGYLHGLIVSNIGNRVTYIKRRDG